MPKQKVTFADIAARTGFSKTTISRFFNNRDSLTLENQEIIQKALDELGYQENKLAKVLANGQTEFIGIVIPNLYLSYYAEMLDLILSTYEDFGYKFLVFLGNDKKEIEQKYISELLAYKIEGLIVLSHTISSKELAQFDLPIVTIERESDGICGVTTNNELGGRLAAKMLAQAGAQQLVHINAFFPESSPAQGRITGFFEEAEKLQLPCSMIRGEFGSTYQDVKAEMSRIFDQVMKERDENVITGFFLANDTYANLFLNLVIRHFKALPPNIKIVGFDGSTQSADAIIPFSTIAQQKKEMVHEAMKLLVLQIEGRKKRRPERLKEPVHIEIDPVRVDRDTTRHGWKTSEF